MTWYEPDEGIWESAWDREQTPFPEQQPDVMLLLAQRAQRETQSRASAEAAPAMPLVRPAGIQPGG